MAKTESTAVNALIDQLQNNKPPVVDPGADLFGSSSSAADMFADSAKKRAPSPSTTLQGVRPPPANPARMTGTVPTMKVAADVAPLPRTRAPASTGNHPLPPPVRMGTAPQPRGTTIPPLAKRTGPVATTPPTSAPVAAPFEVKGPSPFISPPAAPARFAIHSSAALQVPPVAPEVPRKQELFVESEQTMLGRLDDTARTRADNIALAKKLVLPAIACIAAGIGLGFYVNSTKAKSTAKPQTAQTAPAPTKAAPTPNAPETETVRHPIARSVESQNSATSTAGSEQPEPPTKEEQAAQVAAVAEGSLTNDAPAAAVAAVRDVQTAKGVVALKDVRIDTDPQGASITLVDGGKQFPLGSTPLSTSLDSSREYDVIIELAGRPSQMVHLAPASTSRLDISLGKKSRAAAPATVDAPKATKIADDVKLEAEAEKATAKTAKAEKTVTKTEPAKTDDAKKATKASKTEVANAEKAEKSDAKLTTPATDSEQAAATGNGTLMISSKPPCEIHIDGSPTGLTTPQRSIELSPGKHKITFVNADQNIKTSFNVMIKAGEPTKLIKDFLSK
jgi:hypothetical protein